MTGIGPIRSTGKNSIAATPIGATTTSAAVMARIFMSGTTMARVVVGIMAGMETDNQT